jgi:hypothetical protein
MPSSVDPPPIALKIHLTGLGAFLPGAAFVLLWAYSVFYSTLALPLALRHVGALRAAGTYNPVPGWLGPGAWLAYWLTTLAALARAARALFNERENTPADDGGADDAWDPDLTASALFTLFAAVALLGDSRRSADIAPNLLVLCAEGLAVLAGLCTGCVGSFFWLAVLLDLPPREIRWAAPGPLVRTALRWAATYGALLVGSASVLLVFSLRMSSPELLAAARGRGSRPAVLVYDTFCEGSVARLAGFLLFESVARTAAALAHFARGGSLRPCRVRRPPDPPLTDACRRWVALGRLHLRRHVLPKHAVARPWSAAHGHPGPALVPELGRLRPGARPAYATRYSGPRGGRPAVLSHASEPGTRRGASGRTSWTAVINIGQTCDCHERSP